MSRELGLVAVPQDSMEELWNNVGHSKRTWRYYGTNGQDCEMEWQAALGRGKWIHTGGNVTADLGRWGEKLFASSDREGKRVIWGEKWDSLGGEGAESLDTVEEKWDRQ